MPLTYSITKGIGLGIISFVVLDLVIYIIDSIRYSNGKTKVKPKTEVTLVTLIVFILFLIYFLVPTVI